MNCNNINIYSAWIDHENDLKFIPQIEDVIKLILKFKRKFLVNIFYF